MADNESYDMKMWNIGNTKNDPFYNTGAARELPPEGVHAPPPNHFPTHISRDGTPTYAAEHAPKKQCYECGATGSALVLGEDGKYRCLRRSTRRSPAGDAPPTPSEHWSVVWLRYLDTIAERDACLATLTAEAEALSNENESLTESLADVQMDFATAMADNAGFMQQRDALTAENESLAELRTAAIEWARASDAMENSREQGSVSQHTKAPKAAATTNLLRIARSLSEPTPP